MKVELNIVLTVLSIFVIVGGFLWWLLGRILTEKKDKLTLAFRIKRVEEMIAELKIDTDKVEQIQTELEVIKERIKHL